MKNIEMFVITHKDLFVTIPEGYKVIGVGEYGLKNQNTILSDSINNNISVKNPNYCELTAIYWLWKNYDLPDYVGICHYRRFFVHGLFSRVMKLDTISSILNNYDVILPKKVRNNPDVWHYFVNSISGYEHDLLSLEKLIKDEYNDYYESFEEVMHSNAISYCNMCVMSKKDFNSYCEWLFELLSKYEQCVDLSGYTQQEQRIYGFMSEFLINVWVKKNNKRTKYVNSMLFTTNIFTNFLKKVKILLKGISSNVE